MVIVSVRADIAGMYLITTSYYKSEALLKSFSSDRSRVLNTGRISNVDLNTCLYAPASRYMSLGSGTIGGSAIGSTPAPAEFEEQSDDEKNEDYRELYEKVEGVIERLAHQRAG